MSRHGEKARELETAMNRLLADSFRAEVSASVHPALDTNQPAFVFTVALLHEDKIVDRISLPTETLEFSTDHAATTARATLAHQNPDLVPQIRTAEDFAEDLALFQRGVEGGLRGSTVRVVGEELADGEHMTVRLTVERDGVLLPTVSTVVRMVDFEPVKEARMISQALEDLEAAPEVER